MLHGTPYHIGVVVKDLDAAMRDYGRLLGASAFARVDTGYPARFGEWTGTVANRNAFARVGDIYVELVEPGEGRGPQRRWLEERGPGMFHVGLSTPDPTQRLADAPAVFEVLNTRRPDGNCDIVYLDTVATLGYYVELVAEERATQICAWIDRMTTTDGEAVVPPPAPDEDVIDGRLYHVGVAVAVMDAGIARYGAVFGMDRFARLPVEMSGRFGEWAGTITEEVAFARWGGIYLELVAPETGVDPTVQWLEERGEGLYHVGLSTTDPTQRLGDAPPVFEVLSTTGPDGRSDITYLDTLPQLGYYTELVAADRVTSLCAWIDEVVGAAPDPRA